MSEPKRFARPRGYALSVAILDRDPRRAPQLSLRSEHPDGSIGSRIVIDDLSELAAIAAACRTLMERTKPHEEGSLASDGRERSADER